MHHSGWLAEDQSGIKNLSFLTNEVSEDGSNLQVPHDIAFE